MNLYPAIQGSMGSWQYYTVKMSMRELADNVKFATDFYDDRTLDEAIQRVLDEGRVKTDLVRYLIRQKDRFFSSIVVAALHGNPQWYPITIEDDERFTLFRDDERLSNTFGVLKFDGSQNYFALDGQHRLSAIKALVNPNSPFSPDAPAEFKNEEISVIVVVPSEAEEKEEFLKRYRRLFGNLNRYAKPTDNVTNIIMDEDDAFAILTRRLITEHPFFMYSGRQQDSIKVKTKKGKNLRSSDSYFTSLETLYSMNITLLGTRYRKNNGWNLEGVTNHKEFAKYRPEEDYLDQLFEELCTYWNSLIDELPTLQESPPKMRNHAAHESDDGSQDNFLFWPIGQELLAEIARDLLDSKQTDPTSPTPDTVKKALFGLSDLNWNAHEVPFRHIMLVPNEKNAWNIRSEDRKKALILIKRIFKWQLGIYEFAEDEIEELKESWKYFLVPALDESTIQGLWNDILSGVHR
ncbi:MAG: DGQHR domain-containing protein [Gammaproteobacteria bacterium]|nr:DGQHR domain-containing protein [Gammaproteobacteria bacterium]